MNEKRKSMNMGKIGQISQDRVGTKGKGIYNRYGLDLVRKVHYQG